MNISLLPFITTAQNKRGGKDRLEWLAIAALILVSAACIAAGAGSILRYLFPVLSLVLGIFLYIRSPMLYTGLTWWLWMLTPFVARLADYQGGWDPQRIMMVTPFLVTFIPLISILKQLPKLLSSGAEPIVLAASAVMYGALLGRINYPIFSVIRALLDWLSPLVFSLYLFMNWRNYPQYRQNMQRVFTWGVFITGLYGIYQYLVAPPWDRLWLIESGMFTSSGNPEPMGMRIWSTMHSPGPFSAFIAAGLIIIFTTQSPSALPVSAVGYLSLLLTLVRTAWGSWLIALFFLLSSVKQKLQIQLIRSIVITALLTAPLAIQSSFAEKIGSRLLTFTNLSKDNSFNTRSGIYESGMEQALYSFVGNGLGGSWNVQDSEIQQVVIDSGIIDLLMTLGWVGTIPYIAGLLLATAKVTKSTVGKSDLFVSAARAVSISYCLTMIMGTAVAGLSGLLIWAFLGISLSADKYYRNTGLDYSSLEERK